MTLISAVRRQADLCEFRTSLAYVDPVSKHNTSELELLLGRYRYTVKPSEQSLTRLKVGPHVSQADP